MSAALTVQNGISEGVAMSILLNALGIDPDDPEVVAERHDFHAYADLVTALVERRKELGLSQKDVAEAMGTRQSAVSAIETSSANPTIQRLQRYARALGVCLELGITLDTEPRADGAEHSSVRIEQSRSAA